jgi:hypothetical protein
MHVAIGAVEREHPSRHATPVGARHSVEFTRHDVDLASVEAAAWRIPMAALALGFLDKDVPLFVQCCLRNHQPLPTIRQVDGEGERRLSCRPPCEFRRLLSRIPSCPFASTLFCLRISLLARAPYHIHPCIFSFPPSTSLAIRVLLSLRLPHSANLLFTH